MAFRPFPAGDHRKRIPNMGPISPTTEASASVDGSRRFTCAAVGAGRLSRSPSPALFAPASALSSSKIGELFCSPAGFNAAGPLVVLPPGGRKRQLAPEPLELRSPQKRAAGNPGLLFGRSVALSPPGGGRPGSQPRLNFPHDGSGLSSGPGPLPPLLSRVPAASVKPRASSFFFLAPGSVGESPAPQSFLSGVGPSLLLPLPGDLLGLRLHSDVGG